MKIHIVRKVNGEDEKKVSAVVNAIATIIDRSAFDSIILDEKDITRDTVIIAIGGDGTVLHAAKLALKYDCLLAGINVGHLGFLPDFDIDECETLLEYVSRIPFGILNMHINDNDLDPDEGPYDPEDRLKEYYQTDIEQRRTITAIEKEPELPDWDVSTALNEMYITNNTDQVLKCEVYVDGKLAFPFVGDGLIISTPTGSTAYSLSAGGSIMDPMAEAIQIVPVASHMLTMRPIVVNADSKITVKSDQNIMVRSDGQIIKHFAFGDEVHFASRDDVRVKMIRNRARHVNIFDVLKDKLYFSSRND